MVTTTIEEAAVVDKLTLTEVCTVSCSWWLSLKKAARAAAWKRCATGPTLLMDSCGAWPTASVTAACAL